MSTKSNEGTSQNPILQLGMQTEATNNQSSFTLGVMVALTTEIQGYQPLETVECWSNAPINGSLLDNICRKCPKLLTTGNVFFRKARGRDCRLLWFQEKSRSVDDYNGSQLSK
ncbi:hypothetical protein DPMN_051613 [Dreissena polymorpha]|uniref:Uncharacterized protein n=1 Tax=Dreissena polymorpha TaxID=45954 RepID=A0A9D4CI56_DREPO|nr:hypothetical protein DPMN_051613 [Dreissena polymorpha]